MPILYRQKRVGERGQVFEILKFRSMRVDAERDGVARWAGENDPRVTRVGRFLRKSRIDELPQLVNVLRGDMSFVGPRPERPPFVTDLSKDIPVYSTRHAVKPGITGWAQVQYPYGASRDDAAKKLQFDLYYVKNHSLFLDLVILFQTAQVVLFGKGAR
jgi:lipopolysaccharide/colanic/teichoic acid biosynthesis glycosyltransferase